VAIILLQLPVPGGGSLRECSSAGQMTMPYLANPNPDAVSQYVIAIGHWEVFLSQA
jgi:hypothetical protein